MNEIGNVNVNFSELVKELKEVGVTKQVIANRTGCSYPTISRIEKGESKDPQWSVAAVIIQLHTSLVVK